MSSANKRKHGVETERSVRQQSGEGYRDEDPMPQQLGKINQQLNDQNQ